MQINIKPQTARVGNVEIHDLFRVTELDSGLITGPNEHRSLADGTSDISLSHTALHAIEMQLAIVVPCMNEERSILEGVLRGIPHDCLIVLVSNSNTDIYKAEFRMLADFCTDTQREGIAVHQQDPGLARAFLDAGMPQIVENTSESQRHNNARRIRNGKGEAMMIGTVFAKLAGAVHEYCKVYAAGLHYALHNTGPENTDTDSHPHAMVRIKWKSKPKIVGNKLVPQEFGRCSRVVNEWMSRLLNSIIGECIDQDFIRTANAGEHAMSVDLALQLSFATGYAVEPFQLIDVWERSGIFPPTPPSAPPRLGFATPEPGTLGPMTRKLKILQIETLNPHIHDFGKGAGHIQRMQAQGLGTIYHSGLAPPAFKDELKKHMRQEISPQIMEGGVLQQARAYPPMGHMDFVSFEEVLKAQAGTLNMVGGF
ncbi:Mannosyl-3-phosphoglycerate synthase [Ascochyta rabiei]|uniref:Mannosyl-3-phosphoglycerate synthase n=1 Tax=Didymella rabiei TaxID=5454 RepID=UPI0018FF18CF|nr:Mannosyl-3-phosphoglycerate synthase [Ascochyta rabiei]UPX20017.1 Mannosyl-3-phosphoglycerate synthase [Ascochyta rabiei]